MQQCIHSVAILKSSRHVLMNLVANIFFVLNYLLFLHTTSIFGEGFRRDTLVLTPSGSYRIDEVYEGSSVFCLDSNGKLVVGTVSRVEKFESTLFFALKVKGGEIFAQGDQYVFSPKRNAWVKIVELDLNKDSVLTNIHEPTLIEDRRKIITYLASQQDSRFKVMMYKISVKDHENFFVSSNTNVHADRQYMLVHNFAPVVIPLATVLFDAVVDFGINLAVACVAEAVTEEVASRIDSVREKLQKQDGNSFVRDNSIWLGKNGFIRNNDQPQGAGVPSTGGAAPDPKDPKDNQDKKLEISQKSLSDFNNHDSEKYKHVISGKNNKSWIKHQLGRLGKSQDEVAKVIVDTTQKAIKEGNIPSSGKFTILEPIQGEVLEIRGIVKNGIVEIGTSFIRSTVR